MRLHRLLLRVAYHELARRRSMVPSLQGPEFDDVAHQAADDALLKVLGCFETFRGDSRFTTWAYKFVMFEISGKVASHAWRRQPPTSDDLIWERLADGASRPEDQIAQREQLKALSAAIGELPRRQHEVFVAVALNDVSIDALALRIGSNRNAIYKNLFDARRSLRAKLASCE